MRASRGVDIRPLILLFNGGVGKCLSAGMLAVPYGVGCTVHEADHVLFPVCLLLARAALHNVLRNNVLPNNILRTNQSPMWSPNSRPRTLPPLLNLGSGQFEVRPGTHLSSRIEVKVERINCSIAAICGNDDTPRAITYSPL